MIYKIDKWCKYDALGNVTQELYCLSDMYGVEVARPQDIVMMNKVDQEQRSLIAHYAQRLKTDNTLFIVEDPLQLSADTHKKIAAFIPLQKSWGFAQPDGQKPILLHFLADTLSQWGCDVVNVEYRQQRIISSMFYTTLVEFRRTRSPLLSVYSKNINTLYGATLPEIAQESERALARMHEYFRDNRDNQALGNYYERIITQFANTMPYVELLRKHNYCYWDCMDAAASDAIRSLMLDAFLLWGYELLDAYALQAINSAPDRKKICIIMGGFHIYNISTQLPLLGYHKEQTIGTDSFTEQEHMQRVLLMSELCDMNQFVPAETDSWVNGILHKVKRLFSKNIFVNEVSIDAGKLALLKKLCTKSAYVNPISSVDFEILLGTIVDKSPVIDAASSIKEQQ